MYRLLFFDPRMLIIWKISCAVSQMIYYGQITKCRAFCIEKWKILPSFWDCSAAMELLLMWRSIKPDIDVPHQIYLKLKLNSIKMYCFLLKFWIGENYDDGYFLHLTDMFIKGVYHVRWHAIPVFSSGSLTVSWLEPSSQEHRTSTIIPI